MLGTLLGEVLVEQGGEALLESVEEARRGSIRRREQGRPVAKVRPLLSGLGPAAALELVRAFSAYFSLTNLAEQVHRIRRRREHLMRTSQVQRGSLRAVVEALADGGYDASGVRAVLDGVCVTPVLTAHPTQATRRTILAKEQRIARLLVDRFERLGALRWRRGL